MLSFGGIICLDMLLYGSIQKKRGVRLMDYMTVKEAAELWGYSESTIRKWCKNDKIVLEIHAEKVSNCWRIPRGASCPKRVKAKLD